MTEKINVAGKEVNVCYVMPDGWTELKGAQTAPKGYRWISNNKSRWDSERKTALLKDSEYKGMTIEELMNELHEQLLALGKLEKMTSRIEEKWNDDPENAEFEREFDNAYSAEFKVFMRCAGILIEISENEISFHTAKKMICTQRDLLVEITA